MTTSIRAIADRGDTHGMDPNHGSFFPYHRSSSVNYVTLGNGAKDPIAGYGTTLVRLRGKVIDKRNIFNVPGLRALL